MDRVVEQGAVEIFPIEEAVFEELLDVFVPELDECAACLAILKINVCAIALEPRLYLGVFKLKRSACAGGHHRQAASRRTHRGSSYALGVAARNVA
jgi:hypothetical protein